MLKKSTAFHQFGSLVSNNKIKKNTKKQSIVEHSLFLTILRTEPWLARHCVNAA